MYVAVVFNIQLLTGCLCDWVFSCDLVSALCLILEHLCFRSRLSSSIVFTRCVRTTFIMCGEWRVHRGAYLILCTGSQVSQGRGGVDSITLRKDQNYVRLSEQKVVLMVRRGNFFLERAALQSSLKEEKKMVRKQQQIP